MKKAVIIILIAAILCALGLLFYVMSQRNAMQGTAADQKITELPGPGDVVDLPPPPPLPDFTVSEALERIED